MSARTQVQAASRILWFNGIIPLWRQPLLMASVFLTPLSFVFFLYVIGRGSGLFPYGVIGGVIFMALFTGNGMLNDCAYLRLERQLQQVFVASPVRPGAYIFGMAMSELAFALPALALFLVILELVHPFGAVALAALVGVVLLTWFMSTALGFLISTMFKQLREIWPIGTLVFSTLSVLPPIFYPISELPDSARWVAFVAPSTYSAQLAESSVGLGDSSSVVGGLLGQPLVDAGILAAFAIGFGLAAAYLARWREP